MIQNIRPRILNKSASPSVIKSTEMLDAVNIVVDGIDSSDTNVVKKVPGNIKSYLLDGYDGFDAHESLVNIIGDDVVIGSVADEERQRIFYFTHGKFSAVNYSSIYMLEQFSEDEILIVLVCRTPRFDFLAEDFVASDILRVPRSEVDYFEDLNFSGVLDEGISGIDDFSEGNAPAEIQVDSCPTSLQNQLLPPTPGSVSSFNFNTSITNIGDFTYVGANFSFGFGTPTSPSSVPGLSIESIDPNFSNGSSLALLGGETAFITLRVESENDLVQGDVYPIWFQLVDVNGNVIHTCEWELELVILVPVTPIYRMAVATSNGGTGATNTFIYDDSTGIVDSELNLNGVLSPGDPEAVSLDITLFRNNPSSANTGEYFPARSFSLSLTPLQQSYFDIVINQDDNVSALNATNGVIVADFPEAFENGIDKMSFSIVLRTDVNEYPTAGSVIPYVESQLIFNISGGEISLAGSSGGGIFSVELNIEHRLPAAAGQASPNITISGVTSTINLDINNPNDPDFNGSVSGITFTVTNSGNADGYYALDASPDEPSITNQGKGAILSMGKTFDISNSNPIIYPIISTVVTDDDPTIYVTGDLNAPPYLNFLQAGFSEQVVIRMDNRGSQFENEPLFVIGSTPGPGEYHEMGSVFTNGSVTVSCRTFPSSFSGSGVNYSVLNQTPISSSVTIPYNITAAGSVGELIIKPSQNATAISRDDCIIENTGDKTLTRHMFTTGVGLDYNLAGALDDEDTYLRAFYGSVLNFNFLSDSLVALLDGGTPQSNFLGSVLSGVSNTDVLGGGMDLVNTTQDSQAADALVTITVDVIQAFSGSVYSGALPYSLQGHQTAGSTIHDPDFTSQSPQGATGSLGYIVFYTDPISLVGGHNPEFFPETYNYYKTQFNQNLVYPNGSPYQDKFGGYRQATISVPPNTWVKTAIIPFWQRNALDDVEQDINTLDLFGFLGPNSITGPSPIVSKVQVNIAGGATNPDADLNGNLFGQIIHLNGNDLDQSDLFDVRADVNGPALRPSGPGRREVQPIDASSLPLQNGSSTSSLQANTSNEPRSGSLNISPTRNERIRLKSSKNKTKKKRRYGNR